VDEKAGAAARGRGVAGVITMRADERVVGGVQFRSSAQVVVGLIQVSVGQKRSGL